MNSSLIVEKLHKHGLKATPQRIWVYDYLINHRTHPDCDEVYAELMLRNQRITRTTVHNTLQALVKNGLALEINIDPERIRYDGHIELHGHFKCSLCGRIYDFDVKRLTVDGLDGFDIRSKDVCFNGVCKNCKCS